MNKSLPLHSFLVSERKPNISAEKKLSDRTHNCPVCGLAMDRDLNAAINILKTAVHQGRKTPPYLSGGSSQIPTTFT
jgi:transposase